MVEIHVKTRSYHGKRRGRRRSRRTLCDLSCRSGRRAGGRSAIAAMISYCTGLLLPSERKSVEPIAALTAPARTAAQHQSLLHFVGQGDWSDDAVMQRIRA